MKVLVRNTPEGQFSTTAGVYKHNEWEGWAGSVLLYQQVWVEGEICYYTNKCGWRLRSGMR